MDIVVSDDHGGLTHAVRSAFQGATWQRCQARFLRNITDHLPKDLKSEGADRVKAIHHAPDLKTSRTLLDAFLEDFQEKAPFAKVFPLILLHVQNEYV